MSTSTGTEVSVEGQVLALEAIWGDENHFSIVNQRATISLANGGECWDVEVSY
jgi:hypothetical protein